MKLEAGWSVRVWFAPFSCAVEIFLSTASVPAFSKYNLSGRSDTAQVTLLRLAQLMSGHRRHSFQCWRVAGHAGPARRRLECCSWH